MLSNKTKAEYLNRFKYYSHDDTLTWQDIQGALRELVADGKLYIKSESIYWNKNFWDAVLQRMIVNYRFINEFAEAVARTRSKRKNQTAVRRKSYIEQNDEIEQPQLSTSKESDMEYMSRRLLMDDDVYYNGRAEESFFSRTNGRKPLNEKTDFDKIF